MNPIRDVLVLGGGSAGLLAALTLKIRLPQLRVRIVHSREIGIIGVGEGSTSDLPFHLHGFLGLEQTRFFREAQPVWKLGVRFEWGRRAHFNYTFTAQVAARLEGLKKNHGYFAFDDFEHLDVESSLMSAGRVFAREPNGCPRIRRTYGYHIENAWFVEYLERVALENGVAITEGRMTAAERGENGVAALVLDSGERVTADLFVDASGFRSELIGATLDEPFTSYADTLFCDRAVAGGWERKGEPILPYTTAETMNAGWAWQIEHERHVNRGYVFSSAFMGEDEAEAEFRKRNPRVTNTRLVKFTTGRRARCWVGNVFAVGNANGFVEPLEATAIFIICQAMRFLAGALEDSDYTPPPSLRDSTNRVVGRVWDEIRDFLAVHYRFNDRLDTPFWRAARNDVALHGAAKIVRHYRENGPSTFAQLDVLPPSGSIFQLDGFYTLLIGQRVRWERMTTPGVAAAAHWAAYRARNQQLASVGFSVPEALAFIRHPNWRWTQGFFSE